MEVKHIKGYLSIMGLWLFYSMPAHSGALLPAPADCAGYGDIPVNEIYKYDPSRIKQCIQDGVDPPGPGSSGRWLKHRSGFASAPSAKILGNITPSIVPAHRPVIKYKNRGCNSYERTGPGGASDGGADDACDEGQGTGLFTVPDYEVNVPEILEPEIDCLTNLIGQLGGLLSGNNTTGDNQVDNLFRRDTQRGIDLDARADVNNISRQGACAGGSVGICGVNIIRKRVCTGGIGVGNGRYVRVLTGSGGQDVGIFARREIPKYVEVDDIGVLNYVNSDLNRETGIYLEDGGVVSFGNVTYNVPPGGFVTMDDRGQVYIGVPGANNYINDNGIDNDGIVLQENQFVNIRPFNGTALVDSSIFEGETIGADGEIVQIETVQGADATEDGTEEQIGEVRKSAKRTEGATELPPENIEGINTENYAGAFPPGATLEESEPPEVNAQGEALQLDAGGG